MKNAAYVVLKHETDLKLSVSKNACPNFIYSPKI